MNYKRKIIILINQLDDNTDEKYLKSIYLLIKSYMERKFVDKDI